MSRSGLEVNATEEWEQVKSRFIRLGLRVGAIAAAVMAGAAGLRVG